MNSPHNELTALLEDGTQPAPTVLRDWTAVLSAALSPPQQAPHRVLEAARARVLAAVAPARCAPEIRPRRKVWSLLGWAAAAVFAVLWAGGHRSPFFRSSGDETAPGKSVTVQPQIGLPQTAPGDATPSPGAVVPGDDSAGGATSRAHVRALPSGQDAAPLISVPRAEYETMKAALARLKNNATEPASAASDTPASQAARPFLMELRNPAQPAGSGTENEPAPRKFIDRSRPPAGSFTLPIAGLEEIGGGYFYDRNRDLIMEPSGDGRTYQFRPPGPDFDRANPRLAPIPDLSEGRDAADTGSGYVWVDPATGQGSLILPAATADTPPGSAYWLWATSPGSDATVAIGLVDGSASGGGSFEFTLPHPGLTPGSFIVTRETGPMPARPSDQVILRGP